MRKVISILCLAAIVILAACSKSNTTPDPASGSSFKFSSLTATDTLIKVNELTTITAIATGDGLTYQWSEPYGTFVGSGATVQWTVCHKSRFNISCLVKDRYNHSETKIIVVKSYD